MKTIEHLTKEQIAAYAASSPQLARAETDEIEIHLLQCAACRDLMPAPTPEQFWSALLIDEPEREESFATESFSSATSPFSSIFSVFNQSVAMGVRALGLVAVLSLLIWLVASKQANTETEVARTIENPQTENNLPKTARLPDVTSNENLRDDLGENPPLPSNAKSSGVLGNNPSLDGARGVVSDPIGVASLERESKIEIRRPAPKNTVLASKTRPSKETSNPKRLFAKNENVLRYPAELNRVIRSELLTLKGSAGETDFALIAPVGTFIRDGSPTLVWQKVPDAARYEVAVRSAKGVKTIVNESTSATNYKVPGAILDEYRGQVMQWSVTAYALDGTSRTAPSGSEPEALFVILNREKVADVEKRIFLARENPLTGIVLLANAGLLDDAENEINNYLTLHPRSKKARILLKQIRSWRKVRE